jgi:hypothetical protein
MLAPGPLFLEPLPLGPRVVEPHTFDTQRAAYAAALEQSDAVLTQAVVDLTIAADEDPIGDHATTAAGGELAHAEILGAADGSPAASLTGAGEDVETLRLAVVPHLPPPESAIEIDFVPPPVVPPLIGPVPTPPVLDSFGCPPDYQFNPIQGVCVNIFNEFDTVPPG